MYTYYHVISRLTEAKKIRLLTDLHSLTDPELHSLGVPRVVTSSLRESDSHAYPSLAALARSWDPTLLREVSARLSRAEGEKGTNHLLLPPAGTALFSDGIRFSEDPHLSGTLAGAVLAGANDAGVPATLTGHGFTPADARHMDTPPSPRFLSDHLYTPYAAALNAGRCTAIILEDGEPAPAGLAAAGYTLIRRHAPDRQTVICLARGELVMKGSAASLQAALHTHRRLVTAIEHGKATTGELEEAIALGEAMDTDTLNQALDRLLTFAAACEQGTVPPAETAPAEASDTAPTAINEVEQEIPKTTQTPLEAEQAPTETAENTPETEQTPAETAEIPPETEQTSTEPTQNTPEAEPTPAPSEPPFDIATSKKPTPPPPPPLSLPDQVLCAATVLLENRNALLPLRKPAKLALLGDWGSDEILSAAVHTLTAHGHTCVGHAPGYPTDGTRNDRMTREAAELAASADILLVFLRANGQTRLPASRLALMDQISRAGKRTVVILAADRAVDMDFATRAVTPPAALLLLPADTEGSAAHAVETVLGLRAPAGHLTETLTDSTDPASRRENAKVGPFVGYRYYDTLGFGAAYPFGHGLTYTHFAYKRMKVTSDAVTFTVKNTGKRPGTATPQLYVGIQDSAIPRPRKELTAFTRVPLAPGESAKVTLPLRIPPADGTAGLTERGIYTLSVGESVSDIRLTATIPAGNDTLPPDHTPLRAYFPDTNILTEHYTLEAEYRPMKPSIRNILFGIAALALAAGVKIYDIVTASGSVFLNIVAALLAVGAICFFVLEMKNRKKQFARERAELEAATAALFGDAEDIPMPSADALFETAARAAEQDTDDADDGNTLSNGVDHFRDVDRELTFSVAARALTTLAAEEGLSLEASAARGIFAAMASSRLILVKDTDAELFKSLTSLLGSYFDCPVAFDRVDESYTDEVSLLFGAGQNGRDQRRNAAVAMEAARRNPRTVQLVTLTDVSLETLSAYFVPYARYARAPLSACNLTTHLEDGSEVTYTLPENLWFLLNLRPGESLDHIPDYVAEVAALQTWRADRVQASAGHHSEFSPFRYGQMLYLCDRVRSETVTDEETWKRIDRIESYARRYSDFRTGNKLWIGMETYLAVLLSDGVAPTDALDEALAVKLLPALIPALSGKLPQEERGLSETLEAVLGDGNADLCRRTVKESGADLA